MKPGMKERMERTMLKSPMSLSGAYAVKSSMYSIEPVSEKEGNSPFLGSKISPIRDKACFARGESWLGIACYLTSLRDDSHAMSAETVEAIPL